jgi:hypothetical protein
MLSSGNAPAERRDRQAGKCFLRKAWANPDNDPPHVLLGTCPAVAESTARARVWALGVVLYEMLTWRSLFQGETISDTRAAVMVKEPNCERVPAKAQRVLKGCLETPSKPLWDWFCRFCRFCGGLITPGRKTPD